MGIPPVELTVQANEIFKIPLELPYSVVDVVQPHFLIKINLRLRSGQLRREQADDRYVKRCDVLDLPTPRFGETVTRSHDQNGRPAQVKLAEVWLYCCPVGDDHVEKVA